MIRRLPDYLRRAAERYSDRGAVVLGEHRLRYAELETVTNQLARLLQAHGCRAGARVCVIAAKSPWTIAGLLAVLKAGGMYVPIDSAGPAARVARIVESAQPSLVLADPSAAGLLDELIRAQGPVAGIPIGVLDPPAQGVCWEPAFTRADAASLADGPLADPGGSDDPRDPDDPAGSGDPADPVGSADPALPGEPGGIAQLLFTSGSTGAPKGVMVTHASVIAFIEWAVGYFGFQSTDRISGHPPLHFDLSTFDIYATFAAGAELHLVPGGLGANPRKLAAFIRDRELTQWFSVPSVLTYLAKFDVVAENDFPALQRLLWCGEVLPTPVLAHWMRRLPNVRFTNLYGPTEATIASSFHTVPDCPRDDTAPIPIGTACAGEELLVLDAHLRPVPRGETGDLYLAGVGLSPGYWRDEATTAAAFGPDPRDGRPGRLYRTGDLARVGDDGLVYFLGRADTQIKSRGYRIELGEIEAAVNAIPGVRECAVVGVPTGGFEGTTICCAFAALDGAELSAPTLRQELVRLLPAYMLPARWIELDGLPKNVNGKIDRTELRDHFARQHALQKSAAGPAAETASAGSTPGR